VLFRIDHIHGNSLSYVVNAIFALIYELGDYVTANNLEISFSSNIAIEIILAFYRCIIRS